MRLLLLLVCACGSVPDVQVPAEPVVEAPKTEAIPQGPPKGEKHPPIPADNPAWKDDTPGFRSNYFFYGERSWADVRMRVAGQIAAVERDRARLSAMAGDPAEASARYQGLADRLRSLDLSGSKVASGVRDRLVRAAVRDARLLRGIADGEIPEDLRKLDGTLASIRAELLHWTLARDHRPSPEAVAAWVAASDRIVLKRPGLKIDSFEDFDDRHQLRLRLLDAYIDGVDPIGFSDPWGYWEDQEIGRQSRALLRVAAMVAPLDAKTALSDMSLPPLKDMPRWQRASRIAAHNPAKDHVPAFTAAGLGRLPTGDSLIDVAGSPGPMAIGELQKLGLEDVEHRAWLEKQAAILNQALVVDPATVAARLRRTVQALDAHGHGSRFYNIKAARNEGVRQLARKRAFLAARDVLAMNRPLHHQDWACPNRDGILKAIEGRLLASAADPRAEAVLSGARQAAEAFLTEVDRAEAAGR